MLRWQIVDLAIMRAPGRSVSNLTKINVLGTINGKVVVKFRRGARLVYIGVSEMRGPDQEYTYPTVRLEKPLWDRWTGDYPADNPKAMERLKARHELRRRHDSLAREESHGN